jgi:hypothetical protein
MKVIGYKPLRLDGLDILALVAVIVIGLIHLPYPFSGDQALFTIGALKISNGAVLYRDFWDLKQPGLYGFYLIGGILFGFNEVGIHTFELLYMAIFSIVLMKTLRGYYTAPSMAGLVPLLTVGVYYGVSGQWHLTQLEALVGFPMFLTLWYGTGCSYPNGRQSLRFFLSGVMAGIVLLFKFMFLPIVAAFWLTTLVDTTVSKREPLLSTLIRIGVPVVLGVAVPLLIVLGYFAANNTMGLLYWTFFEYPAQLMRDPPYSNSVINGLRWLISQFAPLMALGFIGAYIPLTKRRDRLLTVNLVLWVMLGLGVILLQRFSRWEYHYLLLFVPLGVLSVKALDILWEQMKALGPPVNSWKGRTAGLLGLVLLFSPVLNSLAVKSLDLTHHGFGLTREERLQYQRSSSSAYLEALAEVRFLSEPGSLPGDIYIIGDPIYYLLSGRNQAIALNGWGPELWLPSQSTRLTVQLTQACPPYIFNAMGNLIPERSPGTARFIDENYRPFRRSNQGVWYVVKANGQHPCGVNRVYSDEPKSAFKG